MCIGFSTSPTPSIRDQEDEAGICHTHNGGPNCGYTTLAFNASRDVYQPSTETFNQAGLSYSATGSNQTPRSQAT